MLNSADGHNITRIREEARTETRFEITAELLRLRMDVHKIAHITKLPLDKVNEIKNLLQHTKAS
jgi:hypothetical protein